MRCTDSAQSSGGIDVFVSRDWVKLDVFDDDVDYLRYSGPEYETLLDDCKCPEGSFIQQNSISPRGYVKLRGYVCPFCLVDAFDRIELKRHLLDGGCSVFERVEYRDSSVK